MVNYGEKNIIRQGTGHSCIQNMVKKPKSMPVQWKKLFGNL